MTDEIKPVNWEPIDFTVYLSFIKWPVLVLVVSEFFLRSWIAGLEGGVLAENLEVAVWILRVMVFALMGKRVIKFFGSNTAIGALAGAMSGFIVGVAVSLFRFIDGIRVWKFFNIITETVLVTIVGSLTVTVFVFLFGFKYFKKNK